MRRTYTSIYTPHAAATCYVRLGWQLYPLGYRSKAPLRGTHGYLEAAASAQAWRAHPSAGVAVACGASGIVVLDGDVRHGAKLAEAVAAFGSGILDTVRQRSGGGGWHLFFQASAALDIRNLHLAAPRGWELIGKGFGVVLYPSIHPCGHRYQWELAPWHAPVLPLPPSLIEAATHALDKGGLAQAPIHWALPQTPTAGLGETEVAAALDYASQLVAKAPEGERNDTLFAAARYLGSIAAGGLLPVAAAKTQLTAAAAQAGLGEREAYHTIQSGMTIGAKRPVEEGDPI